MIRKKKESNAISLSLFRCRRRGFGLFRLLSTVHHSAEFTVVEFPRPFFVEFIESGRHLFTGQTFAHSFELLFADMPVPVFVHCFESHFDFGLLTGKLLK